MFYRMIITGTRMRRLCLMRRGSEITRSGHCRNGGGKVGGEAWIDGEFILLIIRGILYMPVYGQ